MVEKGVKNMRVEISSTYSEKDPSLTSSHRGKHLSAKSKEDLVSTSMANKRAYREMFSRYVSYRGSR